MDAKKYYNTDNNNQFKVLCRFRPLTSAEKRDGYHNIVQIDEKTKTNCQINVCNLRAIISTFNQIT
jgi:hypothetical protein